MRRELQEKLNPPVYGWHNVRCPNYVAQEQIIFRNGAQKYEAGTHNLLGLVGLVAAMELILELGVDNIASDLLLQIAGGRARHSVRAVFKQRFRPTARHSVRAVFEQRFHPTARTE